MNNTFTMPTLEEATAVFGETASGPWSVREPVQQLRTSKLSLGFLRPISFGIAMALSPMTVDCDPWVIERRRQSQPTAFVVIDTVGRRRVSRREARQLAMDFLQRMESMRLQAAENLARLGFDLEEGG
ncbi:MAG: hypothetical protein HZA51_12985 [Planctomycetes bacterium]|nr:hypothetical protein [Planctomycetota bacterium]